MAIGIYIHVAIIHHEYEGPDVLSNPGKHSGHGKKHCISTDAKCNQNGCTGKTVIHEPDSTTFTENCETGTSHPEICRRFYQITLFLIIRICKYEIRIENNNFR